HRLYSAAGDHALRVWDARPLDEGGERVLRTFTGHTARVTSVAFDRDGRRVLTASMDGTIRAWDVTTGQGLQILGEPAGPVHKLALTPDGVHFASAHWSASEGAAANGFLKLWDSRTCQERRRVTLGFEGFISVAFSPDGHRLAAAGDTSVAVVLTT